MPWQLAIVVSLPNRETACSSARLTSSVRETSAGAANARPFGQAGEGFLQTHLVNVDQCDLAPLAGEDLGHAPADSGSRPGDNCNFVFESHRPSLMQGWDYSRAPSDG
jgi:hypothetical protein